MEKLLKIDYWHSREPFAEFVAAADKNGGERLSGLDARMAGLGLSVSPETRYGETRCVCFSRYGDAKRVFSGYAFCGGKLMMGTADASALPNDVWRSLPDCSGVFTYLDMGASAIRISQDFFGQGILTYYEDETTLIVSNRYHLLLLAMAALDIPGRLNPAKALTWLYSLGTFTLCGVSREMDIQGAYMLPLDREIIIDSSGWQFAVKPEISGALAGRGEIDPNDVLETIQTEITENINAALNYDGFDEYILDVSDFKDDRMLLAAASKIPGIFDKTSWRALSGYGHYTKWEFLTIVQRFFESGEWKNIKNPVKGYIQNEMRKAYVPRGEHLTRSLAEGMALRKHFGAKLWEPSQYAFSPLPLKDALTIGTSYTMGLYTDARYYLQMGFSPLAPVSCMGDTGKRVRLSCGGARGFQGGWHDIFAKHMVSGKAETLEDMVNIAIDFPAAKRIDSEQAIAHIIRLVCGEISRLPGASDARKFDIHSAFYMNRVHSGLREAEIFHGGSMIVFPLLSKTFFKAVYRLAPEERREFYLSALDSMASELRGLMEADDSDASAQIDEWYASYERSLDAVTSAAAEIDPAILAEWNRFDDVLIENILAMNAEIKEHLPVLGELLDETALTLELNGLRENINLFHLFGRYASLYGQLKIFDEVNGSHPADDAEFNLAGNGGVPRAELEARVLTPRTRKLGQPLIWTTDELEDVQYAWYILLNGVKIETQWYCSANTMYYIPEKPGSYCARVYVKNALDEVSEAVSPATLVQE